MKYLVVALLLVGCNDMIDGVPVERGVNWFGQHYIEFRGVDAYGDSLTQTYWCKNSYQYYHFSSVSGGDVYFMNGGRVVSYGDTSWKMPSFYCMEGGCTKEKCNWINEEYDK